MTSWNKEGHKRWTDEMAKRLLELFADHPTSPKMVQMHFNEEFESNFSPGALKSKQFHLLNPEYFKKYKKPSRRHA